MTVTATEGGLAAAREKALEQIVDRALAAGPLSAITDRYFTNTARIVATAGDAEATYAIFLRRRVIAALEPARRLLRRLVPEARVTMRFAEGEIVPAEAKIMEVTGSMTRLSEVETVLLQLVGLPCVCAANAYDMCRALPRAAFMDMHARHGAGPMMNLLAAYGAAVGSEAARAADKEVKGFIGSSQDLTAPFFGRLQGMGTMPHSLVGYAGGDVLEAVKLFVEHVPEAPYVIALVDYQGREIDDALRCARWFYEEARLHEQGKVFGVRLDTHGGRFCQGLDWERSVETVGAWLDAQGEYAIVEKVLGGRAFRLDQDSILVDRVRRHLFGAGVSVAACIHMRSSLDAAGFRDAIIVASSGFTPQKCEVFGATRAPVDMVGTGSFLPVRYAETFATADIIAYDGERRVKVGREHLLDEEAEGKG